MATDVRPATGGGRWVLARACVVAVCALASVARADDPAYSPSTYEALVGMLKQHLPSQGALEVVYVAKPPKYGEVAAGFNAATGEWYRATTTNIQLQDAQGRVRCGGIGFGRLIDELPDGPSPDELVEQYFPFVILRDIIKRPDIVDRVEERSDGGFRVALKLPGGARFLPAIPHDVRPAGFDNPQSVWVEVDREGRVESQRWSDTATRPSRVFTYSPESPSRFPMPTTANHGEVYELKSFTFTDNPSADAFSASRVESIGVGVTRNVETAMAAAAASREGSGLQSGATSGLSNPMTRYQLPLIATGGLIVIIGVYTWWRRSR